MKRSIRAQDGFFVIVSGAGWLMDFSVYMLLATICAMPVNVAKCILQLPQKS